MNGKKRIKMLENQSPKKSGLQKKLLALYDDIKLVPKTLKGNVGETLARMAFIRPW